MFNRDKPDQSSNACTADWQIFGVAFVVCGVATWIRFHSWAPTAFNADDLFNYLLYHGDRYESLWFPIFFAEAGQKFRFVFSAAMRAEISLFGTTFRDYLVVNLAIHSASCAVLCVLIYRTCRSFLVSLIIVVLAATSRLGLYQVTQVTGQVESIPLLFCLLCVLSVDLAGVFDVPMKKPLRAHWKWAALLFAFFSFNAHERYLVLLPWLAIFFVFYRRAGSLKDRVIFASLCVAMVVINALVKLYIFHSNFLQGTGGQHLQFSPGLAIDLFGQAVLSIFGINHGPEYLTGAEWNDFSAVTRLASVCLTSVSIVLLSAALTTRKLAGSSDGSMRSVSLLALIALLILPTILTIRMEQRWELAPFFLLLLILAAGLNRILAMQSGRVLGTVLIVVFVAGSVVIESTISRAFNSIFYVYAGRFGDSAKREVVDSRTTPPGTPVVFVTKPGNCIGTLLDGGFFVAYESKYRKITCVDAISDAPRTGYPKLTHIFLEQAPGYLVDMTAQWGQH